MCSNVMKKLFVFSVLALFASMAQAVGMGRLNVLSALGQPLRVEIELLSVDKQELGTLNARLASPRAYERSNLPMGAAGSTGIRVSVEKRANGEPYIRVISTQPVNEPFVNLVIELSSLSGPVTREFAVLLDPPELMTEKPAVTEARPPVASTAAVAEPKTPAPAALASPAVSEYGPVRRGETLSRIASKVRPHSATVEQTMLGIFRNNPAAFINNNMNLLKAGRRLRIPDADQIAALPQSESTKALRAQTAAWSANRRAVTAAADAGTPKSGNQSEDSKAAAVAKDGASNKYVVKLSRGTPAPGKGSLEDRVRMLEEDLAARERALSDANERIKKLEKVTTEAPAAGSQAK